MHGTIGAIEIRDNIRTTATTKDAFVSIIMLYYFFLLLFACLQGSAHGACPQRKSNPRYLRYYESKQKEHDSLNYAVP